MGDFVIFSYLFRVSGLEGFLSSIPGTRNQRLLQEISDFDFPDHPHPLD